MSPGRASPLVLCGVFGGCWCVRSDRCRLVYPGLQTEMVVCGWMASLSSSEARHYDWWSLYKWGISPTWPQRAPHLHRTPDAHTEILWLCQPQTSGLSRRSALHLYMHLINRCLWMNLTLFLWFHVMLLFINRFYGRVLRLQISVVKETDTKTTLKDNSGLIISLCFGWNWL